MDLNQKVDALKKSIFDLTQELDGDDVPQDRISAIEAEVAVKANQIEELLAEKRQSEVDRKLKEIDDKLKAFTTTQAQTKAAAILAGVQDKTKSYVKSVGQYSEENWLKAIINRRTGDPDAVEFVKAVLGTSDATGQALVPNNFVGSLVEALRLGNPYRELFEVIPVANGGAVDVPYEVTEVTSALLQGAYGSNKDVRDFGFAQATATLYTIAQIADIGNQLLRQSNGAAERAARGRLADSIARREAEFVNNGTGSSQPLGFFPAIAAFGNVAAFKTTLSSEPRLATIARGIAAMESRGANRNNLVFVCNPTDYWEMASEGLGTSYAGGWAVEPAAGAASGGPIIRAWGVELRSDATWPAAKAGTGLLIDNTVAQIFVGGQMRIDVSNEAGSRFDQNITGFRAEEEFGFTAEPTVRTGRVQEIIGI